MDKRIDKRYFSFAASATLLGRGQTVTSGVKWQFDRLAITATDRFERNGPT
jgi:hypothetical protein